MEQLENNRYKQVIEESKVTADDAVVAQEVERILSAHFAENDNVEVYKQCFNAIDLTSLNSSDTVEHITKMVDRVNAFETDYPELPNVAAICVYPNFAVVVSGALEVSGVDTAVVAGSFPSSQTFLEIKTTEAALAVADGANEVDIVTTSAGKMQAQQEYQLCGVLREYSDLWTQGTTPDHNKI